ncbi:MAG: winged helix-turn-helix transcriptional regulator [Euryarchaeota archaeon]|nr:winged helix-turn-helix transcriptional regulator [Euryarchaeota archaeon]
MMELLTEKPGLNQHQLSKLLDVNVNTIRFHIRRLEHQGFVETRTLPGGREIFCFRAEDIDLWDSPSTRLLLGSGTTREVALFLAEHPAVNAEKIAAALGLSIYSVRRHIRALDEEDLVSRLRVERQVFYHAEPELLDWAEEVKNGAAYEKTGLDRHLMGPTRSFSGVALVLATYPPRLAGCHATFVVSMYRPLTTFWSATYRAEVLHWCLPYGREEIGIGHRQEVVLRGIAQWTTPVEGTRPFAPCYV